MNEGKDQTLAVLSMVFSIVGFVFLPLTMSIMAVILGRIQINRIRNDPEVYGGETFALIGFWIGLIRGSIYMVTFVITMVILFLVMGLPFLFLIPFLS